MTILMMTMMMAITKSFDDHLRYLRFIYHLTKQTKAKEKTNDHPPKDLTSQLTAYLLGPSITPQV